MLEGRGRGGGDEGGRGDEGDDRAECETLEDCYLFILFIYLVSSLYFRRCLCFF